MGINSETQGLFTIDTARLIRHATTGYADGYLWRLTYAWAYRPPWVQTVFANPSLRRALERFLRGFLVFSSSQRLPSSKARRGLHPDRQAVDFNLFIQNESGVWVYQRTSEAHRPLGIYWESLSPYNRWGGRFEDGNHYERRSFPWQEIELPPSLEPVALKKAPRHGG